MIIGFGTGISILFVLIGSMLGAVKPYCSVQSSPVAQMSYIPGSPVEKVEALKSASLTLPFPIPNTTLVAERIVQYEGGFLEDGSNDEVVNIVGLVLRNSGDEMIHCARVVLERGLLQLCFEATYIPPDASVLVLEKDRQQCLSHNFTACYGWQKGGQEKWVDQGAVQVEAVGMNTILLTNISEETCHNVTFYYKNYLEYAQMYVGGITNRCAVGQIEPGQTVEVSPYHFASGYSKVLGVTAE